MRLLPVLLIVAFLLGSSNCSMFDNSPHTPDAALIANFENNRDDFEKLAAMCREDANMSRIASNFLWRTDHAGWPRPEVEWGITKRRWDEYRGLFAKLRLPAGLSNAQPKMILLLASTRGMVGSGSTKGYAYLAEPPPTTPLPLDDYKFEKEGAVYRHLDGNWYLFLET